MWNGLRRALVGAGISGTTNRCLRYFHVSLASAPGRHHLGMSAAVGVTTGIGADADVGSAVSVSADVDFGAPVGATLYTLGGFAAVAVATIVFPLITVLLVAPLTPVPVQRGAQSGLL